MLFIQAQVVLEKKTKKKQEEWGVGEEENTMNNVSLTHLSINYGLSAFVCPSWRTNALQSIRQIDRNYSEADRQMEHNDTARSCIQLSV